MRLIVLIISVLTYVTSNQFTRSSFGFELPIKPYQLVAHQILTSTLKRDVENLNEQLKTLNLSSCPGSQHAPWVVGQMHTYLSSVIELGRSITSIPLEESLQNTLQEHLENLPNSMLTVEVYALLSQPSKCLDTEGIRNAFRSLFQAGKVHFGMEIFKLLVDQADEIGDFRLPAIKMLHEQLDKLRKVFNDLHKRHIPLCPAQEADRQTPVFHKEITSVRILFDDTFMELLELFTHMSLEYAAEDHSTMMNAIHGCLTVFDAFPMTLGLLEKTCTAPAETLDEVHWPFFELGELAAHREMLTYYAVDPIVKSVMQPNDEPTPDELLDGELQSLVDAVTRFEDALPILALRQEAKLPTPLLNRISKLEKAIDNLGISTPRSVLQRANFKWNATVD